MFTPRFVARKSISIAVEPQLGQEIRRKTREAMEETLNEVVEATLTFGQACPLTKELSIFDSRLAQASR